MTGRIIKQAKLRHTCDPPMVDHVGARIDPTGKPIGPNNIGLPEYWRVMQTGRPGYPRGTIWLCDECSQHWAVQEYPRVAAGQQMVGNEWGRVTRRQAKRATRARDE